MPWHTGKPAADDFLSVSVQHIRENFAELEPLHPHVAELVDLTTLHPHIAAILDSRIVEMGSNSNGTYVRWEDGLQICFFISTSRGTSITWTFPAAFVAVPVVQVSCRRAAGGNPDLMNFTDEPNTTSVTIQKWYWTGSNWANAADEYAHLLAIGRWK